MTPIDTSNVILIVTIVIIGLIIIVPMAISLILAHRKNIEHKTNPNKVELRKQVTAVVGDS